MKLASMKRMRMATASLLLSGLSLVACAQEDETREDDTESDSKPSVAVETGSLAPKVDNSASCRAAKSRHNSCNNGGGPADYCQRAFHMVIAMCNE